MTNTNTTENTLHCLGRDDEGFKIWAPGSEAELYRRRIDFWVDEDGICHAEDTSFQREG